MSTTPRTDEATYPADCLGKTLVVNRNCSAALETELTRLRDENKLLRAAQKISEDSDGAIVMEVISLRASAEKAEDELAAEREKVKVLREALDYVAGWPVGNQAEIARDALAATKEASK